MTPKYRIPAFNCPTCGVYSQQDWNYAVKCSSPQMYNSKVVDLHIYSNFYVKSVEFATCNHCKNESIWQTEKMIYPTSGTAPLPNLDMPDDVKKDYMEAREIVSKSPNGAAALLRLAVQKLCKHLGEKGENINIDIANLVKKGLLLQIQKALDSVRVIGNHAVHPGQINIDDDPDIALKLFGFINVIVDVMITQPSDSRYDKKGQYVH